MKVAAAPSTTPPDRRVTPQRRAVLSVLQTAHDHPTAAEVYERVRTVQPGIGAATVYRALARLVDAGQALELTLGDATAARYDANVSRHDHVVCTGCGRAVDVDAPFPPALAADVAADTGFAVRAYTLQFHGTCPDCSAGAPAPS